MRKNVLIFGSIAGVIAATFMVSSMAYCHAHPGYEGSTSMLVGYASMLLAFSLIFVGVKNYRDKYNGGVISFGKAFRLGLGIALIGSSIYVLAWLIDYYVFIPDFMDKYAAHSIKNIQASGASAAVMKVKIQEVENMKSMYKSPVWIVLFTYLEILPVGLIVSLIAALLLKKKGAQGEFAAA